MRYFPLDKDAFEHQFGIRALPETEPFFEATESYLDEIQQKRDAIQQNRDRYYRTTARSLDACRDAAKFVLRQCPYLSGNFERSIGANGKTGERFEIDRDRPLLSVALEIQEDLAIMANEPQQGFPLIAGVVCFPSGWSVEDKLGQSVLSIHRPVPDFEIELGNPTLRLMERLKVDRPVWRMNWGVRPTGQLDQSPIHSCWIEEQRKQVSPQNAGQKCFFRVERQTFARLESTGDVLFAIHTHQCPLEVLSIGQQRKLLGVIKSCPQETLAYKGILGMRAPLVQYLQNVAC